MKKVLVGLVLLVGAVNFSSAQVNPHAIGLRFGQGYGFASEVTYQHGLGTANRLEADLGIDGDNLNFTGIYQWNWNIVDGLNWYVGPGATVGLWSNTINLGVGGQIGLEYDFKSLGAPILVSLDSRPMWNINSINTTRFRPGTALSVRYVW
jgi:hypothetical protein